MDSKEQLSALCNDAMRAMGLSEDKQYKDRLKWELIEVDVQDAYDYFLHLKNEGKKYPNENNLLVPYLLGICSEFSIEKEPECTIGDYPDIDVDYIQEIRDYLKHDWAPKTFGSNRVAHIGTYGTYHLNMALIDMARIFGKDRREVLDVTTNLPVKDDDGNPITWETALELSPAFKEYCEKYPEVADAAKRLCGRNRNIGQHAGGLIIAGCDLTEIVPLMGKDYQLSTAWSEGQASTDLSQVGLVKFDLLVVDALQHIVDCIQLIKKRHGLDEICALPGQPSWSDTTYLNDPQAIAMASAGDLKMIFQFGSEGIRRLARRGGVTSFDDLVAYAAIYRPGPLQGKVDEMYCKRKRGEEQYEIDPILEPVLGKGYGLMIYQEDIMRILNVVGKIPLRNCVEVIKAISKKKIEKFAKYRDMFIENGQVVLKRDKQSLCDLWDKVEFFSGYGFNKSVACDTIIPSTTGFKPIQDFVPGDHVYGVDIFGETTEVEVVALHDHGVLEAYEVTFDDGYTVSCSANHKFLTKYGQKPLWWIVENSVEVLCDDSIKEINAQEERGSVEGKVRNAPRHTSSNVRTSEELREVSPNSQEVGCEKSSGRLGSVLWGDSAHTASQSRTPQELRRLCSISLEEEGAAKWREDSQTTHIEMSTGIHHRKRTNCTSKGLCYLPGDQEKGYRSENGQTERGQSLTRAKEDILGYCEEDLVQTGITSSQSRKPSSLARTESRKVLKHYSSSNQSKEMSLENGKLVSFCSRLGASANKLRHGSQTSRFGFQKFLDRSGWLLSLFYFEKSSKQPRQNAKEGRNAQRRGEASRQRDANQSFDDVLCVINGRNENGVVGTSADHAPISNTGRLVSRRIVRVVSVGKRQMYDLEVACPTHNFLLPTGVVTSNSHATAYTYITARQLYLKSHYALEYYASGLNHINGAERDNKLREFKREVECHGIRVRRPHLNKSKVGFDIVDNDIYFGFSEIKGLGIEVAKRIVEGQPYAGFQDFLERFGTESKVIQPLIALGCFDDADPITLYKFYEFYKDKTKKKQDAEVRFKKSIEKYHTQLRDLIGDTLFDEVNLNDDSSIDMMADKISHEAHKALRKLSASYKRTLTKFVEAQEYFRKHPLKLANFDPSIQEIDDPEVLEILTDISKAEQKFFGFGWTHPLEKCSESKGFTFEKFKIEGYSAGPVEVLLTKVIERQGKVKFYVLNAEDLNWESQQITVWEDDYNRFADEIKEGNLVRLRVKPPDEGFNRYTLDGPPRWKRHTLPPKAQDYRVVVLNKTEDELSEINSINSKL